MNEPLVDVVLSVIARAPEWVRRDLTIKDAAARTRAEEALAAMIAAALAITRNPEREPSGTDRG